MYVLEHYNNTWNRIYDCISHPIIYVFNNLFWYYYKAFEVGNLRSFTTLNFIVVR